MNQPVQSTPQTYQRDGPATVNGNMYDAPNYFPNSFGGPAETPSHELHEYEVSGVVKKYSTKDEDNFTQCSKFYRQVCLLQHLLCTSDACNTISSFWYLR